MQTVTYDEQAAKFVEQTGLEINKVYKGHYARLGDEVVAQFSITFTRGSRSFTFDFSNSQHESYFATMGGKRCKNPYKYKFFSEYMKNPVNDSAPDGSLRISKVKTPPDNYSILASLTKYDTGTFENFCGDCCFSTDSISAMDMYLAVQKEYSSLTSLFNDGEMELLAEIA